LLIGLSLDLTSAAGLSRTYCWISGRFDDLETKFGDFLGEPQDLQQLPLSTYSWPYFSMR
jgi:hypothetical protein